MTKETFIKEFMSGRLLLHGDRSPEFYKFCDWIEESCSLNHRDAWYGDGYIHSIADYCREWLRTPCCLLFFDVGLKSLNGYEFDPDEYEHKTRIINGQLRFVDENKPIIDWHDILAESTNSVRFETLI